METINIENVTENRNQLFDNKLCNLSSKNKYIKDISMILEVLNSRFNELIKHIEDMENEKLLQMQQIDDYKESIKAFEKNCTCRININKENSSPNKDIEDVNLSCDLLDDAFNQQISELDIDHLIEMNDSKDKETGNEIKLLTTSESEEKETIPSPKLNKNKSISRIRTKLNRSLSPKLSPLEIKKDFVRSPLKYNCLISSKSPKQSNNRDLESSVICGTPDNFISRSKKLKQSRFHIKVSQTKNSFNESMDFFKPNNSGKSGKKVIENDSDEDDDATMYFPSTSKCNLKREVEDDGMDVETMLNDINRTNFTQLKQSKRKKSNVLNNSYDRIPIEKPKEPKYAYKNSPVRKKSERELLPGWACEDCEKFYAKEKNMNTQELKEKMNACSKHKSKHNPFVIHTPPGYWNPDFTEQTEFI